MTLEKIVFLIVLGLNVLMWIYTADWMIKTNRLNLQLSKFQQEYYSKTYQDNMQVNADMSLQMHTFVKELRNSFQEENGNKIQSKADND